MPKKIYFLGCLLLFLSYFTWVYIPKHILPNVYLKEIYLANKTKSETVMILNKLNQQPIKLQIKDRIYSYTLNDLGVKFDIEKTATSVLQPNQTTPGNILRFIEALFVKKDVTPLLIFTSDYFYFTTNSIFDFSQGSDTVLIDETNKQIAYEQKEVRYQINGSSLKTQLIYHLGQSDYIFQPEIHKITTDRQTSVLANNSKLESVFSKPLIVIIEDGRKQTSFILPIEKLKKIIGINYSLFNDSLDFVIDTNQLQNEINDKLLKSPEKTYSLSKLKSDLMFIINSRLAGQDIDTVIAKIDFQPNTNGQNAQKYLEIDISQQRIYLFENKTLISTHNISTGKYFPTPTGEFKILNKALNAYSDIYHVWMPYWMAFYYHPQVNAYFGIHELPYWVSQDGQKIQRPRSFIGTPNTGGCVALDINVAEDVYNFVDIGTPVYIFI